MRLKECDLAEAANYSDCRGRRGVGQLLALLAGARGLRCRLCDEYSLPRAMAGAEAPGCLVLDQDVFARMLNGDNAALCRAWLSRHFDGGPQDRNGQMLARAQQAGVTHWSKSRCWAVCCSTPSRRRIERNRHGPPRRQRFRLANRLFSAIFPGNSVKPLRCRHEFRDFRARGVLICVRYAHAFRRNSRC